MIRRWTIRALFASFFVGATGCSLALDWNDFSGGVGDGGDDGGLDGHATDGSSDVAQQEDALQTCGSGMQCLPEAPTGWTGPVELFVGASGPPPACGAGFEPTPAFDGMGTLTASPSTCSACGCGAVAGQSCTGPVMSFYVDDACAVAIGSVTVTTSCTTTIPSEYATVTGPVPSGGTCPPSGGVATTPPAAWAQVARACAPTSSFASGCASGQVCAPATGSAFSAGSCVMQTGVASTCPAGYATGPQVFYTGLDDERGCSACQCGAPTGGSCTIASPAIDACPAGSTLNAPSSCTAFTGPQPVKLASAPVLATAGTCGVSGGGSPSGTASPTGATSFCCSP